MEVNILFYKTKINIFVVGVYTSLSDASNKGTEILKNKEGMVGIAKLKLNESTNYFLANLFESDKKGDGFEN